VPSSYTFTASDKGSKTFSTVLKTAGSQSISVVDAANGSLNGERSGLQVTPSIASGFRVSGLPNSIQAGMPFTFVVTVVDSYGNTVPSYEGAVSFASSDKKAALPQAYSFTEADGGVHTFSATLKTSRAHWISVSDGGLAGKSSDMMVLPTAASGLAVTGFPSPTVAGVPGKFQVAIVDPYGNVVHNFTGTVVITSTDPSAKLPAAYTFSAKDHGVNVFTVSFGTTGIHSLFASELAEVGLTGVQENIEVLPPRSSGIIREARARIRAFPVDSAPASRSSQANPSQAPATETPSPKLVVSRIVVRTKAKEANLADLFAD
jgi:hypothetical protein